MAEAAYNLWFHAFPEIGLYQLFVKYFKFFVKYFKSSKVSPEEVKIWNKWERSFRTSDYRFKRYRTTSLVGRLFDVLDHFNASLGYPGQGSGADITVRAIPLLPLELRQCLALVVHDEIVPIVPEDQANDAC
jgi:hypothetical protein